MEIITIIEKYISGITDYKYHRFKSWDNCFKAFSYNKKSEFQILELAFYLASWGMYRGSSGLLQLNHLVHEGAVEIMYEKANQKLKCNKSFEVDRECIDAILQIKEQLGNYYSSITYSKGNGHSKKVTATDTLLSKVMLGTLGCVPAYDQYFIEGLKKEGIHATLFNKSSLLELFQLIEKYKIQFDQAQKLIQIKTKTRYPLMKILDMYFWQIGYDEAMSKVKEK